MTKKNMKSIYLLSINLLLAITYLHRKAHCLLLKPMSSIGQVLPRDDYANHLFLYSDTKDSTYATIHHYEILLDHHEDLYFKTICSHVAFYIGATLKDAVFRDRECHMIYHTTGHHFEFYVDQTYWRNKNELTRSELSGYFRIVLSHELQLTSRQTATSGTNRLNHFGITLYDVAYFDAKFLTFELDEKMNGINYFRGKKRRKTRRCGKSRKRPSDASDNNPNRSTDLSVLESELNIILKYLQRTNELKTRSFSCDPAGHIITGELSTTKSKTERMDQRMQNEAETSGDFVPCAAPWKAFKVGGTPADKRKQGCSEICRQSKGFFLPDKTAFCYRTKVKASPVPPKDPSVTCECGLNNQDVKLTYERCVPSKVFPGVTSQQDCTKKCHTVNLLLLWSPHDDIAIRDCGNLTNDYHEKMLNAEQLVGQPAEIPSPFGHYWGCQCFLQSK